MVHLISRGYVIPILTYISTISRNEKIDASLIRHFVIEVLDIIEEPYSDELKEIILPLVQGNLIVCDLLFYNPGKSNLKSSNSLAANDYHGSLTPK